MSVPLRRLEAGDIIEVTTQAGRHFHALVVHPTTKMHVDGEVIDERNYAQVDPITRNVSERFVLASEIDRLFKPIRKRSRK